MRDIKDYLHLYVNSARCLIQNEFDKDGWEQDLTHEVLLKQMDDEEYKSVTPILRKLSSMTEEEEKEMIATQDDVKLDGYPKILLKADSGETFRYLLSKHFDLFNLIESGLAIDKDTLTK